MNGKHAFTITTGTTVIGRFPTEALALARAEQLAGRSWEDLAVWSPSCELVGYVHDGALSRPAALNFTPAA
jgi:hypothetical protein